MPPQLLGLPQQEPLLLPLPVHPREAFCGSSSSMAPLPVHNSPLGRDPQASYLLLHTTLTHKTPPHSPLLRTLLRCLRCMRPAAAAAPGLSLLPGPADSAGPAPTRGARPLV